MITILFLMLLSINTRDEIATYGKRVDDIVFEKKVQLYFWWIVLKLTSKNGGQVEDNQYWESL